MTTGLFSRNLSVSSFLPDFFKLDKRLYFISLQTEECITSIFLFNFFAGVKYSPVHRLLAPAGLRSGCSMKLMFFSFCTSCCGLNLSVLLQPDHSSDRFLIHFPHLCSRRIFSPSLSLSLTLSVSMALTETVFSKSPSSCNSLPSHPLFLSYLFLLLSHTDLPWNANLLLTNLTEHWFPNAMKLYIIWLRKITFLSSCKHPVLSWDKIRGTELSLPWVFIPVFTP